MDGYLMAVTEARRLGLVEAAERNEVTNTEGARRAGLSLRQFKRLRQRYRQHGPRGLVHGNRGRPSLRRLAPRIREQVETLLRGDVRLNDCHLRDLLAERGVRVSAEAVRQLRRRLGLPPKHRRRPRRYYTRRECAARAGALVLIDGSPFHWFGSDRPVYSLVGTIDDATGVPLSGCFRLQEDLHGFATALRDLIRAHGLPEALYGDRTNIAVRSDANWSLEEELEGRQRPTQFGQMLEELGIGYIPAGSPEAKGRIERLWQTFQDRLTAELALQGIKEPAAAEAFLPRFFARYRDWFGRAAREAKPAWRPAPARLDLALACRYDSDAPGTADAWKCASSSTDASSCFTETRPSPKRLRCPSPSPSRRATRAETTGALHRSPRRSERTLEFKFPNQSQRASAARHPQAKTIPGGNRTTPTSCPR